MNIYHDYIFFHGNIAFKRCCLPQSYCKDIWLHVVFASAWIRKYYPPQCAAHEYIQRHLFFRGIRSLMKSTRSTRTSSGFKFYSTIDGPDYPSPHEHIHVHRPSSIDGNLSGFYLFYPTWITCSHVFQTPLDPSSQYSKRTPIRPAIHTETLQNIEVHLPQRQRARILC